MGMICPMGMPFLLKTSWRLCPHIYMLTIFIFMNMCRNISIRERNSKKLKYFPLPEFFYSHL